MTAAGLAALIREYTGTNSTSFPDATMLVYLNPYKDEIASKIQQRRPEVFNLTTLKNLVASTTADNRFYDFPTNVLNNIRKVEAKFTSSGDFVVVKPISEFDYDEALQESKITNDFDNDHPKYFIRKKQIAILSGTIIAVTSGLKIVHNAFPGDLAAVTDNATDLSVDASATAIGFPKEFHELWARRVSIAYKSRPGSTMKLNANELLYLKHLEEALDNFSVANLDSSIIGHLPETDNDNGFDL
jgi:hypothetical protein